MENLATKETSQDTNSIPVGFQEVGTTWIPRGWDKMNMADRSWAQYRQERERRYPHHTRGELAVHQLEGDPQLPAWSLTPLEGNYMTTDQYVHALRSWNTRINFQSELAKNKLYETTIGYRWKKSVEYFGGAWGHDPRCQTCCYHIYRRSQYYCTHCRERRRTTDSGGV